MKPRLFFLHALSPIHCGTGHAIGGIDLPIAREKPTHIPLVPGSSLKGVLRAAAGEAAYIAEVFGPDTENASDHAGGVQFGDARLAFLPMRSVRGCFAWVTSPTMLRRLTRDAKEAGVELPDVPAPGSDEKCFISGAPLALDGKVVLEDFDFHATKSGELRNLADQIAQKLFADDALLATFRDRVALVTDDVMSVFLRTGMEVIARNRIDPEKGTVANGALWTEEALPVESILTGLLVATPVQIQGETPSPDELLKHVIELTKQTLQVGGHASIGRGLCRMKVL
ncbi:MAG TPA: type III-B CRISPR module RAMP protein Cmr4 [Polyangiaceae bacterium LLY-WYZ-15_(1-7)]|nr:type III-B CRISPR module RAMP protein Cmr4 [Sandaracinus sp.]HJL00265.1 type III-B CRISPR module RAMP protein Cmr4 [Polyangiaceae bacterium LLY-WYZ-15_(1-7)]MBJ73501.1 type III-B CRISPR module RAMP protein Cmr4 [Sandaracinus sp.]HJL08280.1 type III-B CRISPR module RAMP protein Cmr4 [Polyangiaceae bacterium LLY-WYZ-15_(1-7)]HJL24059.1 type III-B CRISPR module RAMP protein Cmr4 [Polyangiaceae bacterium LLY-WYZ-15_(1-7)]